ncbi:hypothetical protein niasHS_005111 [Heterodera schachtii]|uniref:Metaxin glutathione S-transferase domain-containing protein n=1 Tax=Heterodera schachtii TaxID=97005 RepID=A0ABD2JLR1_HETSC
MKLLFTPMFFSVILQTILLLLLVQHVNGVKKDRVQEIQEEEGGYSSSGGNGTETPTKNKAAVNKWQQARFKIMQEKIVEYLGGLAKATRKSKYVHKLVDDTQYTTPEPFEGTVTRRTEKTKNGTGKEKNAKTNGTGAKTKIKQMATEYGRAHRTFMAKYKEKAPLFGADEETVETMMLYVQMKLDKMANKYEKYGDKKNKKLAENFQKRQADLAKLANEMPAEGCKLSVGYPKETVSNSFLFTKGFEEEKDTKKGSDQANASAEQTTAEPSTSKSKNRRKKSQFLYDPNDEEDTVQDSSDVDDDDDEESADETTTYAVFQAVEFGRKGFGPDARLSWINLPEPKKAKEISPDWIAKLINILKYIYKSIKDSMINGTKWTVKLWTDKEKEMKEGSEMWSTHTKNESSAELIDNVIKEHPEMLTEQKRKEIEMKADKKIETLKKLEKVQQTMEEEQKKLRKAMEFLRPQKVHPFDFLVGTVGIDKKGSKIPIGGLRHKISGRSVNEKKYLEMLDMPRAKEAMESENETCQALAKLVEQTLYIDDNGVVDPQGVELRGRLGAQIVNYVINKKDTVGLLKQLMWSVIGTSAIALFFDLFLWPTIITWLAPFLHVWVIPLSIALYSITPLFAETFDSLVIKRVLAMSRGAPAIPKMAVLWQNLKSAMAAGTFAAFGSIPNNALEEIDTLLTGAFKEDVAAIYRNTPKVKSEALKLAELDIQKFIAKHHQLSKFTWMTIPFMVPANILATATSAAMIPMEIADAEEKTVENVLRLIRNGILAGPTQAKLEKAKEKLAAEEKWKRRNVFRPINMVKEIIKKRNEEKERKTMTNDQRTAAKAAEEEEQEGRALEHVVKKRVEHVLDMTKTTGMARNSLATGIVLSLVVAFTPFYTLGRMEVIRENIIKIVLVIINSPTEILSMSFDRFASAKAGWDAKKNRRMVGLLMRNAIEQLEEKDDGPMKPITDFDKQVFEVYYSNSVARGMNTFSKAIVNSMLAVQSGLSSAKSFAMFCARGIAKGVSVFAKIPFIGSMIDAVRKITADMKNRFLPLLAEVNVVQNWRKNVVYLITYPRIGAFDVNSNVPVISPAALKLEVWLQFRGVDFYRVTHGFLLADLFGQRRVPFVELNGKQLIGTTDQIIEELEKWQVAKEKAHLIMDEENMKRHGYNDKAEQKEFRKKERLIRRTFDEIVTRCLLYDRRQTINITGQKMGLLLKNTALYQQMVPTLPYFYQKWFDKRVLLQRAEFWPVILRKGPEEPEWNMPIIVENYTGIASEDTVNFEDQLRHSSYNAFKEIFFRYKWKMENEMKTQKVREYNEEKDAWKVKHGRKEENGNVWAIKYDQLKDDEIADKVINAMALAADQLTETIKKMKNPVKKPTEEELRKEKKGKAKKQTEITQAENQPEEKQMVFLFGDRPTPADASLFAHLVQLFETPLKIPKLENHIKTVKEQSNHSQHVLLQYVEEIKEQIGWEQMKYSSQKPDQKPFNFEWVEAEKKMEKYNGPFDLKFKEMIEFDGMFMAFPGAELMHEREEFGGDNEEENEEEEEENEDEEDDGNITEIREERVKTEKPEQSLRMRTPKREKKKGAAENTGKKPSAGGEKNTEKKMLRKDSSGSGSSRRQERPGNGQNPEGQEMQTVYDEKQLYAFQMFFEEKTWTTLMNKQMLFTSTGEAGNFFWHYPKVVEFVVRKIMRIADCENANDIPKTVFEPWTETLEHGLEEIEDKLKQNELFKTIDEERKPKKQMAEAKKKLMEEIEKKMKKKQPEKVSQSKGIKVSDKDRAATARALLHVTAPHFCKLFAATPRAGDDDNNNNAPRPHNSQRTPENLKACRIHDHKKEAVKQLQTIKSIKDAEELYAKCDEAVEKMIDQIYTNYNKLVVSNYTYTDVTAFKPIHDGSLFTYSSANKENPYNVDRVLLYYYPEVVEYVLHALADVATPGASKAVTLSFWLNYSRVHLAVQQRQEQLRAMVNQLQQQQHVPKENVVLALVHFAAAFLCDGKIDGKDCGAVHQSMARDKLRKIPQPDEFENLVRLYVYQVVVTYNDLIATGQQLDKYGAKIMADLEMLSKEVGFFKKAITVFSDWMKSPPAEHKEQVEELQKAIENTREFQAMKKDKQIKEIKEDKDVQGQTSYIAWIGQHLWRSITNKEEGTTSEAAQKGDL